MTSLAEADYRTEASFPLLSKRQEGDSSYQEQMIPSFSDLKETYGKKWAKEKLEFLQFNYIRTTN